MLVVVMADKFKKGDGSALSCKAKAASTRHLTQFGVKLAEDVDDWYNAGHTLHALHWATALMEEATGATMRLCTLKQNVWHVKPKFQMF